MDTPIFIDLGYGRALSVQYMPTQTVVQFLSKHRDEGAEFELDRQSCEQLGEALVLSPMFTGETTPAQRKHTWESKKVLLSGDYAPSMDAGGF